MKLTRILCNCGIHFDRMYAGCVRQCKICGRIDPDEKEAKEIISRVLLNKLRALWNLDIQKKSDIAFAKLKRASIKKFNANACTKENIK